jgi:hypothetical protein
MEAFKSMGIILDPLAINKLILIESDTSKPLLGLSPARYEDILRSVVYIGE